MPTAATAAVAARGESEDEEEDEACSRDVEHAQQAAMERLAPP